MRDLIVEVNQGQLRGMNEKNINGKNFVAFRGIPFAKPPVGHLRFKDPEPLEQWCGVRNAFHFGGRCAQKEWITREIIGSDDCLYLNVYTLILNPPMLKPVMVWIHGGGFIYGSGEDDFYGPDYLIEKDVLLVTINYRLGILGFLNVEDREAPGNQGLKDQIMALKWIQQNIAKFGGDPNNVTIFGGSAGGASVHYLTLSPLAQGLFHKAILQSGVAINPWASTLNSHMESVNKLATILGKDISNIKEFVDYLRTLDAHYLVETEDKIRPVKDIIVSHSPFLPSVDLRAENPFLTKPVEEVVKAGIKVPTICGSLSHEGMIIIAAASMNGEIFDEIEADPENLLVHQKTLQFLTTHNVTVNDVKKFYMGDKKISSDNIGRIIDLLTDVHFIIGLHHIIEIQSKTPDIPMYLYKFQYEVNNSYLKKFFGMNALKGTCHCEELNFIFYSKLIKLLGKQSVALGSIENRLSEKFTELWTNFAKTGNPTPEETDLIPVKWEPIDDNPYTYKCLKITDELIMGTEINVTQQLIKMKNRTE